jgi:hypothetical protein
LLLLRQEDVDGRDTFREGALRAFAGHDEFSGIQNKGLIHRMAKSPISRSSPFEKNISLRR